VHLLGADQDALTARSADHLGEVES
jgi:hypothetical protein